MNRSHDENDPTTVDFGGETELKVFCDGCVREAYNNGRDTI
jgi:hypothetical protein